MRLYYNTDGIYLSFGADTHIEGLENTEEVKDIRKRAIQAGLKLVDCPIRHLGTEKAQDIYYAIEQHLLNQGVEMLFECECVDLIMRDGVCHGATVCDHGQNIDIDAAHTIVATGRRGADWLEKVCAEHGIAHQPGTVDIGVRVEVRNEVMETVNRVLYESKLIGYPQPFKNKVRTFCQNPGGFVSHENYNNDLAVANGHSYKELKSNNTNLAILCSHNFNQPFNQPIAYAQKVGELTNMLGAGYRAMMNIINFIQAVDHVVPGFAATETLLYSPELKFYSNRIKMDKDIHTSIQGLYCLGDSSGWTRGLMMASVMGVLMGRKLAEKAGA